MLEMDIFCLQLTSIILGLTGSIILAVFLGRVLKMLIVAVKTQEKSIESLAGNDDRFVVTGFDKQLDRALVSDKTFTYCGLWFLVASFSLQIISLLITS